MAWVDIGVNLTASSLQKRAEDVVAAAIQAGVSRQVLVGASIHESQQALALAETFPGCITTAGIHPHDAASASANFINELRVLAKHPLVRAIGECGLDYNRNYSAPDVQREVFAAQLELAVELQLPVYLHERDAIGDQLAILDRYLSDLPAAIVHCFTGGPEELAAYQERGCYIGVTGWVCDERRGHELQLAVPNIAENCLLLETDAPYLMPRNIRPKPKSRTNVPANLPWVASVVADLRGTTIETLAATTTENAQRVFAVWPAGETQL